jgi:hypothetical protein
MFEGFLNGVDQVLTSDAIFTSKTVHLVVYVLAISEEKVQFREQSCQSLVIVNDDGLTGD